jgi:hypothetical protein
MNVRSIDNQCHIADTLIHINVSGTLLNTDEVAL